MKTKLFSGMFLVTLFNCPAQAAEPEAIRVRLLSMDAVPNASALQTFETDCRLAAKEIEATARQISDRLQLGQGTLLVDSETYDRAIPTAGGAVWVTWFCDAVVQSRNFDITFRSFGQAIQGMKKEDESTICDPFVAQVKAEHPLALQIRKSFHRTVFHGYKCEVSGSEVVDLR